MIQDETNIENCSGKAYRDMGKNSRQTQKTIKAIHNALFSLLMEKQYSKVTIQDIIDRADVGRATFYNHFATKDDLLISTIEHLLFMVKECVVSCFEYRGDKTKIVSTVGFFEHVKENNRIMKGLMNADSSEMLFDGIQNYFNQNLEQYLKPMYAQSSAPKIPENIVSNHISGTLNNLLRWWVKNNMPYTPEQMDNYFRELVSPCIDSIFIIEG